MNIPDTLLGEEWCWAAWVVWLPFFARSLWRAPWCRLADSEQLNVWLGMVVLLTLVWSMVAGVKPGLTLHLLGATVFTLCFGPHLAFIGLSLVTAGVILNGESSFMAFAVNALLLAGVGVGSSYLVYRLFYRLFPKHFFVYVFINGFFAAALNIVVVGVCITAFLATLGIYSWAYLSAEYLPYFFLLAFSEAWLSGMVITMFVLYRPCWVLTFDDSLYLND